MADFKTHITVSTAIGVAYGGVAYTCFQPYFNFDYPVTTCLLAGTLCSVSGMLPDLDSDSGVPLRESLTFASACLPMLLLDRFQHQWSLGAEQIAMAGAAIYGAVRFGLGKLLKKYTVHRGMFHSIPAAVIAGEVAFLLCSHGNPYVRAYKAMAVVIGFMSHLVLDEIWSVKVSGGKIGLKSSSGTAVKLWGSSLWANFSTYAKLALLTVLVLKDPMWVTISPELARAHEIAMGLETPKGLQQEAGKLVNQFEERIGPRATGNPASAPMPMNNPQPNGQPINGRPGTATAAYSPPAGVGGVYVPQGTYVPQGLYAPQTPNRAVPSIPPQYGSPGYAPQGYAPAAPAYGQPGYGAPPNYQQPNYQQPSYQQRPGYPMPMGVGPGAGQPRY
jgi:hypothetical protein